MEYALAKGNKFKVIHLTTHSIIYIKVSSEKTAPSLEPSKWANCVANLIFHFIDSGMFSIWLLQISEVRNSS